MRLLQAGLLGLLLLAGPAAAADIVSPAPDGVAVVLYHDEAIDTADLIAGDAWTREQGLGFVIETREIDLPEGPSTIRFRGVASTMVPQTAAVEGLPAPPSERNFDYDLLSPGSLLAKSIGQTVHLVRTDKKTGKETAVDAVVRSAPDGAVLEIGGKLEALTCSGLPERLVFDKAPDGLTNTPTLSLVVDAPKAGHYKLRLSYLATGMNWSADYVARVEGGRLHLSGWLTLANFGATGFAHAPIFAVAGRLNKTGDDVSVEPVTLPTEPHCWPMNIDWATHRAVSGAFRDMQFAVPAAREDIQSVPVAIETVVVTASRKPEQSQLGDYKLYTLSEPTDMPARETKQVQFLDLDNVPFDRVYRFDLDDNDTALADPTRLVLKLDNTEAAGLGQPLPAGQIAMSEPGPGGAPIFIAQSVVRDTGIGLPFEVEGGDVFGVVVGHRTLDEKKSGSGDKERTTRTVALSIDNRRAETVTVEIRQSLMDGQAQIAGETRPHIFDRGFAVWRLPLKPREHVDMRVSVVAPY